MTNFRILPYTQAIDMITNMLKVGLHSHLSELSARTSPSIERYLCTNVLNNMGLRFSINKSTWGKYHVMAMENEPDNALYDTSTPIKLMTPTSKYKYIITHGSPFPTGVVVNRTIVKYTDILKTIGDIIGSRYIGRYDLDANRLYFARNTYPYEYGVEINLLLEESNLVRIMRGQNLTDHLARAAFVRCNLSAIHR